MQAVAAPSGRLENFPVAFFSVVMGLGGLTIAWQRAGAEIAGAALLAISAAVFVTLAAFYAAKIALHPRAVAIELAHPVRLNFFPAVSISLLLLAVASVPVHGGLAYALWIAGTVLHLGLTLWVLSFWIDHSRLEMRHLNPAWFIPVVGNIVVPLGGVGFGAIETSWFFFSVGIVFWLVLLTLVFQRIIFHPPLPERLLPTLAILIAPPAVGFISYSLLTGGLDGFGRVLYGVALFLTLLLATQLGRLARLRFFLSWWAYSFPLAALTLATMRMARLTGAAVYAHLADALLVLLTAAIALLAGRTILAMVRGEICIEEGPEPALKAA